MRQSACGPKDRTQGFLNQPKRTAPVTNTTRGAVFNATVIAVSLTDFSPEDFERRC